MSEDEQRERLKALKFAKKELKKLGKAGLAEIKRMEEEEKVRRVCRRALNESIHCTVAGTGQPAKVLKKMPLCGPPRSTSVFDRVYRIPGNVETRREPTRYEACRTEKRGPMRRRVCWGLWNRSLTKFVP